MSRHVEFKVFDWSYILAEAPNNMANLCINYKHLHKWKSFIRKYFDFQCYYDEIRGKSYYVLLLAFSLNFNLKANTEETKETYC